MINYRLKNAKNLLLDKKLTLFVIIFFEFFGTLLFTYSNLNLLNLKNSPSSNIYDKIMYGFIDFALSMLMCISYTRQFAGGVYNPAVVVFRMLRRTDRFPVKTGIIYILSQISGSIVGAFIALYLDNIDTAPITGYLPPIEQAQHFGTQMVGGFVLTFMVQIVSEKSMTFIDHNRQFYICLPLFYLIAKTYSKSSNCVSPAFGVSFQLVYSIKCGNWQPMAMAYIIILGPTAGALVSVAMFELVLRPLFPLKKELAQVIQSRATTGVPLTLIQAEKEVKVKNVWTFDDLMKKQQMAMDNEDYRDLFHEIFVEDLDDEIDSNEDEEENHPIFYGEFPNPKIQNRRRNRTTIHDQIRQGVERINEQEQKRKKQKTDIMIMKKERGSVLKENLLQRNQSVSIEFSDRRMIKEEDLAEESKLHSFKEDLKQEYCINSDADKQEGEGKNSKDGLNSVYDNSQN